MSERASIKYLLINPFFNYIKKVPLITRSSFVQLLMDLLLFAVYKIELNYFINKIKPSWLILGSDTGYNETIVLSNLKIKSLVLQDTIDSINVDEEIKYFNYFYNKRKFSFFEKIVDRIIKLSPDYNSRFSSLKGPYMGSPIKHFVLKFFRFLPKNEKKGGGKSKFFGVNGDAYNDVYYKYGIPKSKLIVIGNLFLDDFNKYISNKQNIKKKVFNQINIENKNLIILFLQPPRDKLYLTSINLILKSLMRFKENNYILVKTHPKTNKAEYHYLEEKFDCKVIGNDTGFSNKELIASSYFIITMSSTVGLIALAQEIPLITFNFGSIYPNFAPESSIHCQSISEFNEVINELVKEKSKLLQQAIELGKSGAKRFLKLDGKSIDRLFKIIIK